MQTVLPDRNLITVRVWPVVCPSWHSTASCCCSARSWPHHPPPGRCGSGGLGRCRVPRLFGYPWTCWSKRRSASCVLKSCSVKSRSLTLQNCVTTHWLVYLLDRINTHIYSTTTSGAGNADCLFLTSQIKPVSENFPRAALYQTSAAELCLADKTRG